MGREYTRGLVLNRNDAKTGNAPDDYSTAIAFDDFTSTVDIWVFDQAMMFKFTRDGTNWEDDFEIPADTFLSVDLAMHSFNIENKTPGATARYVVVGYWET